ncbi:MAG TPA: ribonucleotide-diphosphate reductase subunit beta [Solirubrobacteraceae bacterium]|jgi:ribonucleoside-diphosphate reductase beta chain|nr:ribonucleotide-diphosphate reductase subunit beta [Solirubrobacteraceae bacterium]
MDPQRLYQRWEREQWSSWGIDMSGDRASWRALAAGHRERVQWHIASFFVGEERVSVELSPLVAAHESAGEAAFLATQQVDEARHAQHFSRFYGEVLGIDAGFEACLEQARAESGPALAELLDVRLHDAASRLWRAPRDLEAKVDFVTIYHMVIEGMLALTGQVMLLEFLDRHDVLGGWREGLRLITRDEHRHVAYGAWLLGEKARDPALRDRITGQLDRVLPLAAEVLVPAGARPELFRPLGWDGVRLQDTAFDTLSRRLRAIGISVPSPVPVRSAAVRGADFSRAPLPN